MFIFAYKFRESSVPFYSFFITKYFDVTDVPSEGVFDAPGAKTHYHVLLHIASRCQRHRWSSKWKCRWMALRGGQFFRRGTLPKLIGFRHHCMTNTAANSGGLKISSSSSRSASRCRQRGIAALNAKIYLMCLKRYYKIGNGDSVKIGT